VGLRAPRGEERTYELLVELIPNRAATLPLRIAVRSAAGRPAAAARSTGSVTPVASESAAVRPVPALGLRG
jgi:hypothetical protein